MASGRPLVERRARWRCEYCLAPQRVCGYRFHVEHILPRVLGGTDDLGNLALACGPCNLAKGARTHGPDVLIDAVVTLFHPRINSWDDHFSWADNGYTLLGLTPTGRATVATLDLNASLRTVARRYWRELGLFP
ncbi:MAG: HNH endonuclease [Chloroflexota bacterium]